MEDIKITEDLKPVTLYKENHSYYILIGIVCLGILVLQPLGMLLSIIFQAGLGY